MNEAMKMVEKNGNESCYMPMDGEMGSCKVESVISTDYRGQMGPLKVLEIWQKFALEIS